MGVHAIWGLQRGGQEPDLGVEEQEGRLPAFEDPGRRLLCRSCGEPVTSTRERIAFGGQHVHRRINPHGFTFEFGCFANAAGVAMLGPPTSEHSWFAGRSWVIALCGRCGVHLGWSFEDGEPPRFFGLVLERLIEEK